MGVNIPPCPLSPLPTSALFSQVPSSGSTYTSGSTAVATLKLSDIGTPWRADVRVEPKGGAQGGIKLDRVELLNNTTGGDPVMFPSGDLVSDGCNAYVGRKVGKGRRGLMQGRSPTTTMRE